MANQIILKHLGSKMFVGNEWFFYIIMKISLMKIIVIILVLIIDIKKDFK
jgi:hypothetical protein